MYSPIRLADATIFTWQMEFSRATPAARMAGCHRFCSAGTNLIWHLRGVVVAEQVSAALTAPPFRAEDSTVRAEVIFRLDSWGYAVLSKIRMATRSLSKTWEVDQPRQQAPLPCKTL